MEHPAQSAKRRESALHLPFDILWRIVGGEPSEAWTTLRLGLCGNLQSPFDMTDGIVNRLVVIAGRVLRNIEHLGDAQLDRCGTKLRSEFAHAAPPINDSTHAPMDNHKATDARNRLASLTSGICGSRLGGAA